MSEFGFELELEATVGGCWELNLDPLQEQYVFLTSGPISPKPKLYLFKGTEQLIQTMGHSLKQLSKSTLLKETTVALTAEQSL